MNIHKLQATGAPQLRRSPQQWRPPGQAASVDAAPAVVPRLGKGGLFVT